MAKGKRKGERTKVSMELRDKLGRSWVDHALKPGGMYVLDTSSNNRMI